MKLFHQQLKYVYQLYFVHFFRKIFLYGYGKAGESIAGYSINQILQWLEWRSHIPIDLKTPIRTIFTNLRPCILKSLSLVQSLWLSKWRAWRNVNNRNRGTSSKAWKDLDSLSHLPKEPSTPIRKIFDIRCQCWLGLSSRKSALWLL